MILVGIDFSETTDAVVAEAATLASALGSELVLVHVAAPDPDFVGYEPGPDSVRKQRASELREEHGAIQEKAEMLRRRGLTAKALLVQGPTVEKLLEEAADHAADRIVIGSHGHGAIHRVLLGSVSEGIVRGARCPVVVVPSPGRD